MVIRNYAMHAVCSVNKWLWTGWLIGRVFSSWDWCHGCIVY